MPEEWYLREHCDQDHVSGSSGQIEVLCSRATLAEPRRAAANRRLSLRSRCPDHRRIPETRRPEAPQAGPDAAAVPVNRGGSMTHEEIAESIKSSYAKIILAYAFNTTGKTR